MAGSYGHCVDDEGRLLSNEDLVGMLENGGDVYEAVEEMYGMIWWLATEVAAGDEDRSLPGDVPADPVGIVEQARQRYGEGLDLSPGYAPEDEESD